jgi:hypothetical protein
MPATNYVRAVYVDPYNYANANDRTYAIEIGRNETTGGSSGNNFIMSLGSSNAIYADGICIAGYASLGSVLNFQRTNSYAIFRNTNGGRMSIIACGDAAGTASLSVGNNTKCGNSGFGVDFTGGYVDILVDNFYMSMDRGQTTGNGQVQSTLGMASGIIDANSAYICYQASGNQTNQNNCVATLTVSNTAVFKVKGTLALGYTTASMGDPSLPGTSYGKINIGPGGTVIANTITVGGTTKASGAATGNGNNIALTSGATLIVSNSIGDTTPNGALGTLSFGGNCTNELFIDGANSNPYVWATNLTTTGVGNTIFIAAVKNISSYPATLHLMVDSSVSAPTFNLRMPPGFIGSGSLLPATVLTPGFTAGIDLVISTNLPKRLVWRGASGLWDNSSKVWLDQATGLMTNFINGDVVAFDDNSGPTIALDTLSSPLLPAVINITNNSLNFVFNGLGSIQSGLFVKQGTMGLEIDAATAVPVVVNQGSLTGSGTIAGASLASGTTMAYAGKIQGSITCAGTATFLNSSTISGQLTVQSGGIVVNDSPNVDLNGLLSVQTGAYMSNTVNGVLDNFLSGSTEATNGTLINNGLLGNSSSFANNLLVNGTFEDLGGAASLTVNALTIAGGGNFIPGGDGIGITTVYKQLGGNFPGAVFCQAGSTTIIKVDAGSSANTMLLDYYHSFGASSSSQTQTGCTLLITNVSATPFSAGQQFRLFQNPGGGNYNSTGTSTNTFPLIEPATPGPGLAWDLRYLWATIGGKNGYLGVVSASALSPQLTNSITTMGTNVVINLAWSADYYGWRLQNQTATNTVGLGTNWTGIAGSWTNTTMVITNNLVTNSSVFYRLVFP